MSFTNFSNTVYNNDSKVRKPQTKILLYIYSK
jgi:hypothetical protein